jgi:NAD(P)-dependent dehydrogenase (short-subunit alcohol dehydrogenase family)
MGRFDGKVAVVTGGTSGIGLASAKALVREGARVVVTGRDPKGLEAARQELGPKALALRADASQLSDLDELAAEVKARLGGVDVLFVNAGIAKFAPAEGVTEAFWDETLGTNLKGAFFTVQKLLPLLRKGASIVLNTSAVNQKGFAYTSTYSVTKAGLRSLARTLAAELIGRGIRVNAVSPGPIETPILSKNGMPAEQQQAFGAQLRAQNPMKRFGSADEVAKATLFLASEEASYITGVELSVDGGATQL